MALFEKYLTEFLDSEMKKYNMPGYDCSIYHHHKEVYRHSNGFADLGSKRPITKNTLYNIYSNTKVITCVAALQLYEQGKFLLEDSLDRFYPEFEHMKIKTAQGIKDAETPIRIKDLFCMAAGFASGDGLKDVCVKFQKETAGECPVSEMPNYLAQIPLEFEPGSHYSYGICHDVLGALVAKISGKRFSEYLEDNIFRPLEMENTGFYIEKLKSDNLATQYRYNGLEKDITNEGARNCLVPPVMKESGGGGLITTVDDYMKFQEALCKGNVILRKSTI
ncbi:MAG: beta-lactamase family protein, partial [Roseburia sp.]|nr:beta-lactamase family protein [Roseburia sp.]